LAILVKSYDAMGMTALRDDALRVLTKNYPQSLFLQGKAPTRTKSWWRP
jgi:outer membrane protein assembly factor BamD